MMFTIPDGMEGHSRYSCCVLQVLGKMSGEELKGRTYQPLFPYFAHLKQAPPAQNGHANGTPQSGPFR